MRVTRRGLQLALGGIWLTDAVLQFQPFMFSSGFAGMLSEAGQREPVIVAAPVRWSAELVGTHPLPWNLAFALVQAALGFGLILGLRHGRITRVVLAASILWSLGVWWLGEGTAGVLSGTGNIITGYPGAVLLYAILAGAIWPHTYSVSESDRLPRWIARAWYGLWVGAAVLALLPAQGGYRGLSQAIGGAVRDGWIGRADSVIGLHFLNAGTEGLIVWSLVLAAIGIAGLGTHRVKRCAVGAGVVFAVAFWVFGQGLGQLTTGMATDPNTGPLLILLALAVLAADPVALSRTELQRPIVRYDVPSAQSAAPQASNH